MEKTIAPHSYQLSQLRTLESEAVHIIREVAAEMERPCLLFSGGKDSAVMLHVAAKAFAPAPIPFPVMPWTPGTTSPRCWPSATPRWPAWGCS
jgi:sulfate adenylyltransferase subunit 2